MKTLNMPISSLGAAIFVLLVSASANALESTKVVETGVPQGSRINSVKVPEGIYAQALSNLDKVDLLSLRGRDAQKPSLSGGIMIGGFIVRGRDR